MIIVKLMGGLGNQMFQYATARRLANRHDAQLRLDLTVYDNMHENDTARQYDLDCYKITGKPASKEELALMLPIDFQASWPYRIKRRLKLDNRLRPLGEQHKGLNDIVLIARDNTYLAGWWQNENYFLDIRSVLLKEFQPKKVSANTRKALGEMKKSEAISIHVRRGDYVTNKYANKNHGLASLDYYKQSMELIEKKVKDPTYFVFSDDIAWCKKSLALGKDAVFVDWNKADRACEDMWLMRHSAHNIVANSSFSWWGAWLNENPDKIVIAPKMWFQDTKANRSTEIVPDYWTRL